MDKIHKNIWLLITVVFALVLTTIMLSDIVIHPWHVMTELGADGGKNHFTFLYQALYGNGIWFQGMNYPYGEHIVYTDGQPALSVMLSMFKGSMTIGRALAIMWWLIALSYVLSVIYNYKLLTHFGVRPIIAMCFAGLITAFSPQVFCIAGHYALAYACIIPMLFYWTVQYYSSGRKKYPVFIFITGVITSFTHPYFAAVILMWTLFYAVGYCLLVKDTLLKKFVHVARLLLAVITVFVIFGVFMKITDPIKDRPVVPFGILANCTHIKDVITSDYSPIWHAFRGQGVFKKISFGGEGYTYIGLAMMVVVIVSLVLGICNKWRKQPLRNIVSAGGFQPVWIFIALAALLFGMGAPFTWHMEWLLDYFSMFRQFRTLGRFTWIFYYIITIYGVVVVYTWYARNMAVGRPVLANVILLLTMFIWGFEAYGYINFTRAAANKGYNNYDTFVCTGVKTWPQFLADHYYRSDSFQAIMVLRFFEVGSEKLWLEHNTDISAWAVATGIQSSMQLHQPMVNCMMSRTSWGQAFKQVRTVGGPYTEKPVLEELNSDRPFLLLVLDIEQPEPDQKYLLEASDLIGHFQQCTAYACYPSRIKANDRRYAAKIETALIGMSAADTCINGTGGWYAAHFNEERAREVLRGTGAMAYDTISVKQVALAGITPAFDQQLYEFSCWFLTPADNYKSPSCLVEVLDSMQHVIYSQVAPCKESTDNYGLWLRDHIYFHVPAAGRYMRCSILRDEKNSYIAMDELLLMPADALIISKAADGRIMVNNHLFKAGK